MSYLWEGGDSSRTGIVFGGGVYRSPLAYTSIGLETRITFFHDHYFE